MSRPGKIASLPEALRDQVSRHLADGQTAKTILPWLNDLPEVRSILAERFNNEPVNNTNLSQWRLGGHQRWLASRNRMDFLHECSAETSPLAEADTASIAGGTVALAAGKLFQAVDRCDALADEDKLRRLLQTLFGVCRRVATNRRLAQIDRQLLLEERRVTVCEATAAAKNQPPELVSKGGLTPETFAKINEALKLM